MNNNFIFDNSNNELNKLARLYDVKKGDIQHDYTRWYNFYLSSLRYNNFNLLEIGIAQGKSIKMWKEYFKNSKIYGIEINNSVINKELVKGCDIFIGNQTDKKFLKEIAGKIQNGLDIIIDDGAQNTLDRIITFNYLFKKLNPGGIYVIENLQTYYQKKFNNKYSKSLVEYLKNKIDELNFNGKFKCNSFKRVSKKSTILNNYEKYILGISFHAGICFIFKRFCK